MIKSIVAVMMLVVFSTFIASAADQPIDIAVAEAITMAPDNAEDIVKKAIEQSPEFAGEIVTAAINAGADPAVVIMAVITVDPSLAGVAVTAAVSLIPGSEEAVVQAAILSGADPAMVAAATAAGRSAPSPFAPASMPSVGIGRGGVTPFGVGITQGGGDDDGSIGGGSASPS